MKDFKDLFSGQSGPYRQSRPGVPDEFAAALAELAPARERCLDCGTGNGQAALVLSAYFDRVDAIDPSARQLELARKRPNISYRLGRAEASGFPDASFDLVTASQAAHWFDLSVFHAEARRLLKPGGILALWGYGLLRTDPQTDAVLDRYYSQVVGPYWAPERAYVEQEYRNLPFPWEEVELDGAFSLDRLITREEFAGYLYSWSATQACLKENPDPVPALMRQLPQHWDATAPVRGRHPLFWRIGRND